MALGLFALGRSQLCAANSLAPGQPVSSHYQLTASWMRMQTQI